MASTYAYFSIETGFIENIILIEDSVVESLQFPYGFSVVKIPEDLQGEWSACGIGWSYLSGAFVEPPKPVVVAALPQPEATGVQAL